MKKYKIMNTALQKIMRSSLYVLLPLPFFAAIYLLAAFGAWEFNPTNWMVELRWSVAIIGGCLSTTGVIIARDINDSKNK